MAFMDNTIPLTTTAQALITPGAGQEVAVFGFVLWNSSGSAITTTVRRYIQASGTTATIGTVSVPANSYFTWPNRISLTAGDQLIAYAGVNSAITADLNWYLESGITPVATGFTPRGTWNSVANYNVNDIVSLSGADYIATTANVNSTPPSSDWMSLANNPTYSAGTGINITSGAISVDNAVVGLLASNQAWAGTNTYSKSIVEAKSAPTISSGTLTVDWSAGAGSNVTLNANISSFVDTNIAPSGKAGSHTLVLIGDGTLRTVTWPSAYVWMNPVSATPTMPSVTGKTLIVNRFTFDGGVTIYASYVTNY